MERKDKKDFRLYLDSLQVVKEMTKEEAGEFLLACIAYWEEEDIEISRFSKLAFANIKAQFDRDFESYKSVCIRNAENGKTGGRPKTQNNPKNPSGYKKTQNNPKNPHTDTDTGTDSDTDNHTDTDIIIYKNRGSGYSKVDSLLIDFETSRKKLKKPMTDKAKELLLKKLSGYTEQEQIEMLEEAIEKGWQSVYPKKPVQNNGKNLDRMQKMASFNIT